MGVAQKLDLLNEVLQGDVEEGAGSSIIQEVKDGIRRGKGKVGRPRQSDR